MGTNLISILFIGMILHFVGFVSGSHSNHHANLQNIPHRCDVDSSEECKNWKSSRLSTLQATSSSISVRFFLHKNVHKPDESVELIPNNIDSIRNSLPHSTNSTWKILIPGFPSNGKSPFPNNVRDAYMKSMRDNATKHYNILIVDWNRDKMCNYDTEISDNDTLTYTGVAGEKVADMLIFLNDNRFLNFTENVHVIAFSIGAHVAGEAARFVFTKSSRKNLIYRISALDPTGADFWEPSNPSPSPIGRIIRVRRSFAYFLDAYHTTKAYGMARRIGDIDFFLNGEGDKPQPGCYRSEHFWSRDTKIDDFTNLCSHVYSTEIFAKSINNRSMLGCTGCDDYQSFMNDRCAYFKCEDRPVFGDSVDQEKLKKWNYPKAAGLAFINTGDLKRFGKKFENQLLDAGEPQSGHKRWRQLC